VIKTADWVIDMGPEGGSGGGKVVVTGTPEQVASHATSHTARFLKPLLELSATKSAKTSKSLPPKSTMQAVKPVPAKKSTAGKSATK
jgi:excinuclease ABC subunit A